MSPALHPIDISNFPDLLKLAEEVETTRQPRALTRNDKTLAVVMPVGTSLSPRLKKKQGRTKADYEAFRKAAGSWKDLIDVEQFKKDIYASRKISTRPPVKL